MRSYRGGEEQLQSSKGMEGQISVTVVLFLLFEHVLKRKKERKQKLTSDVKGGGGAKSMTRVVGPRNALSFQF